MARPRKLYTNPKTGDEKTKREWCDELCIKVATFDSRMLRHGTGSEKVFEGKMDAGRPTKVFVKNPATGKDVSVKEISEETGQSQRTIRHRIARGRDVFSRAPLPSAGNFRKVKKHPYPKRYVNMTVEEIAQVEGVSHMTISNWARYNKWPERLHPLVYPDISVDPGNPAVTR